MAANRQMRRRLNRLALAACLAVCCSLLVAERLGGQSLGLNADAIAEKMQAANLRRAEALRAYTGQRTYVVDYRGFPGARHAEMTVDASYVSPADKQFTIVSESGSKLLRKRVLERLLDSEREAAKETPRTELSPENYSFALLDTEATPDGECYVLQVTPRRKNKFLYRGKIWVDAADYAVTRIEAEPAVKPSFWISHTEIQHRYVKIGDFWLPAHNQSITNVRLGGKATLTIEYTDYRVNPENLAAGAH